METTNIQQTAERYGLTNDQITYVGGTNDVAQLLDVLNINIDDHPIKDSVVVAELGNDIGLIYFVFSETIRQVNLHDTPTTQSSEDNRLIDIIKQETVEVYDESLNEENYHPPTAKPHISELKKEGGWNEWWDDWYQNVHDTIFLNTEDSETTIKDIGFAGKILVTNKYQLP
jgi:hypothetical protein